MILTTPDNQRLISMQCAIIRASNSRFLSFDGGSHSDSALEKVCLSLLKSENEADSLRGQHYQLNKVLIYRNDGQDGFGYRIHQYHTDGQFTKNVECANGGAAAFLFSRLVVSKDARGPHKNMGRNLGTGQLSRFQLRKDTGIDQEIVNRFIFRGTENWWIPGTGFHRNRINDTCLLRLGNSFLITSSQSAMPISNPRLKQMLLSDVEVVGNQIVANCSCRYRDQTHKSLPGSGAICVSGFLAWKYSQLGKYSEVDVDLHHPSGNMQIKIICDPNARQFSIIGAEFTSHCRLLILGQTKVRCS